MISLALMLQSTWYTSDVQVSVVINSSSIQYPVIMYFRHDLWKRLLDGADVLYNHCKISREARDNETLPPALHAEDTAASSSFPRVLYALHFKLSKRLSDRPALIDLHHPGGASCSLTFDLRLDPLQGTSPAHNQDSWPLFKDKFYSKF